MTSRDMVFDLAIIGKGLVGAAAARHASGQSGVSVVLVGPDEPPRSDWDRHTLFASHYDEGRITRRTDPDPVWAALAAASMDRYREIAASSGVEFYHPVGHLVVGPSGSKILTSRMKNAKEQNVQYEMIDEDTLQGRYPYLRFKKNMTALLEAEAGHLSARLLLRAQVAAAEKLGCVCRSQAADLVEDAPDGTFLITLSDNSTLAAKHVLIAAGAFCNSCPLLPDGNGGYVSLDLHCFTAQTVHFHLHKEDAEKMIKGKMPSIIYNDGKGEWAYILPPIQYPDGSWRVKLGGARTEIAAVTSSSMQTPGTHPLKTNDDLVAWFRSGGNKDDASVMRDMLHALLPGVTPARISSDACATCKTISGLPYIGQVREGLSVAAGGCGLAAKSSDEIGRLAAVAALSPTGWGTNEQLDQELFAPQLSRS